MHRMVMNSAKKYFIISVCILFCVSRPGIAFPQDYDTLTDSLMQANNVQAKSKMRTAHKYPYETYLYNHRGLPQLYLRYQEEYLPDGARPMIATDYIFDSTGRIEKQKKYVVEDFRKQHLMYNLIGISISESVTQYNYDDEGKIIEEKHTDIVDSNNSQVIYYIRNSYRQDGSLLSKIMTDASGMMRNKLLYFKESGISRIERSWFKADGQNTLTQTTWYEKPGIPLRILTNDITTTYKNTFNKKGQLVKVLRRNPVKNEILLFTYLKNGLLESITGPENSPETFRFEYGYFPKP